MINDSSQADDHAFALESALNRTYAALRRAKRLVRKKSSTPAAVIDQLNDIQSRLDTVYTQAGLQQSALQDMVLIAQELRQSYNALSNDAEVAYQIGWQDALKHVLENAPGDSGTVIRWLIKTLESDTAWRAPEWDGVIELIREAQRYLAAHTDE